VNTAQGRRGRTRASRTAAYGGEETLLYHTAHRVGIKPGPLCITERSAIMGDSIEVGDTIKVSLLSDHWLIGTVLYIPCQSGDSWRIKTEDGMVVYFQQYDFIVKQNP
jgi:hypothetical protein